MTSSYTRIPYNPPGPSTPFPYTAADLTPSDPSSDEDFYSTPRFVTHIDDQAIQSLKEYYSTTLPRSGRILDLCSSWISHYPSEMEQAQKDGQLEIVGLGMNAKELSANPVFSGRWGVKNLNVDSTVSGWKGDTEGQLDSTTCVVSVDYLTQPLQVLSSIRERTVPGGTIHLTISNRCFPQKVVSRWLKVSEGERLKMCGDYLWYAGWRQVEVLVLSDGPVNSSNAGLGRFMAGLGMRGRDPLWIVRASNPV